jgi:hypothetical protein
MQLNAGTSGLMRLSAPIRAQVYRSPLTIVIVIAKRFVCPPPGYRVIAVNALGVDLEQDDNAVSGPAEA